MVGEVQDCCQLSNSACLQLGPHILYVSRFPGEEFKPESLNLTMKHLLKIMIWCCRACGEVGHCRWNCQCDQMHWYTAEVHGAISIGGGSRGPIRPWPPHRSRQWSLAPLEGRKCNGSTMNLSKSKDFGPPVSMSATDLAP